MGKPRIPIIRAMHKRHCFFLDRRLPLLSLKILQPNMSHLRDAPRKCGGKEEDKAEKYQKFLRKNPSLQGRIDSIVFSVLQCLIFCYHALAVLPDDDVFFIL